MSTITDAMKNEYLKRFLRTTGIRPPQQMPRRGTPHYRMPKLEANGGWLALEPYRGPEIPREEYESLTYTNYPSDPSTFFAPITSASGQIELGAFGKYGKSDLDREWTPNAEKCPTVIKWLESVGTRFGKVQLLRMTPNTLRECRWGLHLDHNNQNNPESNGWAVRVWLELTDDNSSRLVVRNEEFDKASEVRIPLPLHAQLVVDSQWLYHGGYHHGPGTRYAVIATFESGSELERWIDSQVPSSVAAA
jgi:hypothetical protein